MPSSIDIHLKRNKSYSVIIDFDLWNEFTEFCSARYSDRKIFIIVDEKVHEFHSLEILAGCRKYFKSCCLVQIPEGEPSKSVEQWTWLQNELLTNGVERSTPLLAVGGGVTGDLAGFAAASVLRGIPLIHMPTSLLAMVDSSIGGKTGINHSNGKNLIGAFYQPDAVFADIQFLETLAHREWINGLAEMLKYAAIRDPELFDELKTAIGSGFQPSEQWMELIRKCAAIKANIVQQDERESGLRAILNFGHSFGHALERLAGYGNISHGEAVYTGMLASVYVSGIYGFETDINYLNSFTSLYNITLPSRTRIPELTEAMRYDKKVKDETIQLILLNQWGKPYLQFCRDDELLHDAWQAAFDTIN